MTAIALLACVHAQQPQKVAICDLVQNAATYDHKEVEVRAPVNLAFEDFSLEAAECGVWTKYRPIWLTYGSDQPGPTPSTTNDNTRQPGQYLKIGGKPVPLVRDQALALFQKRLFAHRYAPNDPLPCWERACDFYRVTATLRGIFLAAPEKQLGGYGHLGCCNLLAIEQVSDVDAVRTAVPAGGEYKCSEEKWDIDDASLTQFKRRKACDGFRDCRIAMAEFLAQIAEQHWGDHIDPRSGSSLGLREAWVSDDLLTTYSFVRPEPARKKRAPQPAVAIKRTCVATKPPLPMSTPVSCIVRNREYICAAETQ